MGDVVNLRSARKAKARSVSQANAAANRLAHGRTKSEKKAMIAEGQRVDKLLDEAKRERD